jgi:hypothetical protein
MFVMGAHGLGLTNFDENIHKQWDIAVATIGFEMTLSQI